MDKLTVCLWAVDAEKVIVSPEDSVSMFDTRP